MSVALQLYHNDELERGLISSLLQEHSAIIVAIDAGIRASDFYNVRTRACWDSALNAWQNVKQWDMLVLLDDLHGKFDDNVLLWLSDLFKVEHTSLHIKEYATRLRGLTMRREGLLFAEKTANEYSKWDNDVVDVHRQMMKDAVLIGERLVSRPSLYSDLSLQNEDRARDIEDGKIGMAVMTTPFADINRHLSPIERGQMIVVAAREKSGKSRFMLQCCSQSALEGLNVLYVSCEMQKNALTRTTTQMLSRVNATRMQKGKMTDEEKIRFRKADTELRNTKFWIEDRTRDIDSIRNLCLKIKHEVGVDVIAVDYLTKIQNHNPNLRTRQQQIAEISATLAYLAIECDAVLILGSQVNAEGNTREAMDTQQDADKIIKLKRTGADGELVNEASIELTQREGTSFGSGFGVKLRFNPDTACYENMAEMSVRNSEFENDRQDKTNAGF